jgi:DNA-binding XRE family transcriptional regulator
VELAVRDYQCVIMLRNKTKKQIRDDIMIADKIKNLREQSTLTQASLARKPDVTRSSINAWKM